MAHCFSKCTTMALVIDVWTPSVLPTSLQALEDQGLSVCLFQFSRSVMSDSVTPWTAARQASLSVANSWSLPKLMFIESVITVQPSHSLSLSPSPPTFNLFHIRVFSNESVLRIRWPKYWNSSFSISPCNEYSGLIYFRMDCFDLLIVQGTLKSLL